MWVVTKLEEVIITQKMGLGVSSLKGSKQIFILQELIA